MYIQNWQLFVSMGALFGPDLAGMLALPCPTIGNFLSTWEHLDCSIGGAPDLAFCILVLTLIPESLFPILLNLSEKGSSLKGKNLLPKGANSFLLEKTPFQMRKNYLTELPSLKTYSFSLLSYCFSLFILCIAFVYLKHILFVYIQQYETYGSYP